jgi:predicted nucleic acid-binding protein
VRGETWTYLRRKAGHGYGVAFLRRIEESRRLRVMFVNEEQERESLRWLAGHDEREYSFVDATSLILMRSRGIREAFAFDGDFAAAGFVELRP